MVDASWHDVKLRQPVDYPKHVWKHYYAMPEGVWRAEMIDHVQPVSGVLVVHDSRGRHGDVECLRRAKPNRYAKPLDAEAIRDLARLASLRMWDAYRDLDRARDDHARRIAMYEQSTHGGAA